MDTAPTPQVVRRHLRVVRPDDTPTTPEEGQDDTPADPTHRKPEPAGGSATVRALMALGAIAAALGLSSAGEALAMAMPGGEHRVSVPDIAEPDLAPYPAPEPPASGSTTLAPKARPVTPVASDEQLVAYTVPQGNGRHRKPATPGARHEYPGKHHSGRHRASHAGTGQAAATDPAPPPYPTALGHPEPPADAPVGQSPCGGW